MYPFQRRRLAYHVLVTRVSSPGSVQMIMEIPLEVLISTSLEAPWVFYPDFLPMGHPLFEVINSTDAEVSTDERGPRF